MSLMADIKIQSQVRIKTIIIPKKKLDIWHNFYDFVDHKDKLK
jgi:hypothetical protein